MQLTAVVPSQLEPEQRTSLSLLGRDFGSRYDVLDVEILLAGVVVVATQGLVASSFAAGTNAVAVTTAGTYDVSVTNPTTGNTASLADALVVTEPATWLTLASYKAWARIVDTVDDVAIQGAVDAVVDKLQNMLAPETFAPDGSAPADVSQAGLLYVNRLMSRRNSPDGVVGVADLGTAVILPTDSDIRRLLSPYTPPVLA